MWEGLIHPQLGTQKMVGGGGGGAPRLPSQVHEKCRRPPGDIRSSFPGLHPPVYRCLLVPLVQEVG